jgi:FAD binding domain
MSLTEPKVVILGCGPAGLLAAYAAEQEGAKVYIYSKKAKSKIHGAQFLHSEIPGFEDIPSTTVRFDHVGSPDGYAKKVYGVPGGLIQTSFGKYNEPITAYSMAHLYDRLWKMYSKYIIDLDVDRGIIDAIDEDDFDLLVSTIPAPALCLDPDEHFFDAQPFWIWNVPVGDTPILSGNLIVYNGDQGTPWYRTSRLFGRSFIEYGYHSIHPNGCIPANKIIATNCDCRKKWLKTGRFGRWERGVLVHDAYWEVRNAMLKLQSRHSPRRGD